MPIPLTVTAITRTARLVLDVREWLGTVQAGGVALDVPGVGVARAVVAKPKLILADEPTGNLHSDQAREIMELFTRLNQEGTTVIQVTHSRENARYGNRIVQLKDGWVVGEEQVR